MATFEQDLAQVLAGCLQADANVRAWAEQQLEAAAREPPFALALVHAAQAAALPLGTRQFAAVTLKNYVARHWSPACAQYEAPMPSVEDKARIRAALLHLLADATPRIRTALAATIAQIAQVDWPDQWPDLVPQLVRRLDHGAVEPTPLASAGVSGALCVLDEFTQDCVSDVQLVQLAPDVLGALDRLLMASAATSAASPSSVTATAAPYTLAQQQHAMAVQTETLEALLTMELPKSHALTRMIEQQLPVWIRHWMSCLAATEPTAARSGMLYEWLRACHVVLIHKASSIVAALPHLLQLAVRHLAALAALQQSSSAAGDAGDARHGDEGHHDNADGAVPSHTPEQLTMLWITVIGDAARKPAMRTFFAHVDSDRRPSFFRALFPHLLALAAITPRMVQAWELDLDSLIGDEHDGGGGGGGGPDAMDVVGPRVGAADLMIELYEMHAQALSEEMIHLAMALAAEPLTPATSPETMRLMEAFMYLAGTLPALPSELPTPYGAHEWLKLFAHHLLLPATDPAGPRGVPPLVQGRCLAFAARYARRMAAYPDLLTTLFHRSLAGLAATREWDPRLVLTLKSVQSFLRTAASPAFRTAQLDTAMARHLVAQHPALLATLGHVALAESESVDAMALLLDVTHDVVRALQHAQADLAPALDALNALMGHVYRAFAAEYLLQEQLSTLLQCLLADAAAFEALEAAWIPELRRHLNPLTPSEPQHAASGSRDDTLRLTILLIVTLLENTPTTRPVNPVYADVLLPDVMAQMFASDEPVVYQAGTRLVRALAERDLPRLAAVPSPSHPGRSLLITVLAALLQPQHGDASAIHIGEIVHAILLRDPHVFDGVLPDLLTACLHRLVAATRPDLVHALLAIFAHLIRHQTDDVLDFLDQTSVHVPPEAAASPASSASPESPATPAPAATAAAAPADAPTGQTVSGLAALAQTWTTHAEDVYGAYRVRNHIAALGVLLLRADPRLDRVLVPGALVAAPAAAAAAGRRTRSRAKAQPDQWTRVPFNLQLLPLLVREYRHQQEARAHGPDARRMLAARAPGWNPDALSAWDAEADDRIGAFDAEAEAEEEDDEDDEAEEADEAEEDGDGASRPGDRSDAVARLLARVRAEEGLLESDASDADALALDQPTAADPVAHLTPLAMIRDLVREFHQRHALRLTHALEVCSPQERELLASMLA